MKKFRVILLAFLVAVAVVACDNESANQAAEQTVSKTDPIKQSVDTASNEKKTMLTPADISEEAQDKMYQIIFEYNRCMMDTRLMLTQQGKTAQQSANEIMSSCESHLDALEAHLLANNVNESLVIGMTKKIRSRAARKLMTQGMNQMAAQAAAAANAEAQKAEEQQ